MIYLDKNKNNDVVLTLSETTSDMYFLFEFNYESYMELLPIYWWSSPDYSCDRYNLFNISDSDMVVATGATGGVLNLKIGQYNYKIYGSTASINSGNYLITASSSIIEEGMLVVSGINTQIDERYN